MVTTKDVKGYFTTEGWIRGWTPREMERLLGYGTGRMAQGAWVYALLRLPFNHEFELRGYTHWSGGEPVGGRVDLWPEQAREIDRRFMRDPEDRVKDSLRRSWALHGLQRPVKVVPKSHENQDYPPGKGVPQWELTMSIPAVLVRELGPDEKYFP